MSIPSIPSVQDASIQHDADNFDPTSTTTSTTLAPDKITLNEHPDGGAVNNHAYDEIDAADEMNNYPNEIHNEHDNDETVQDNSKNVFTAGMVDEPMDKTSTKQEEEQEEIQADVQHEEEPTHQDYNLQAQ
eukprot:6472661-Ditylum_brightwellii.AAC.1